MKKTEPVVDQSQLVTEEEGGEMIKEGRNMVVRVSKKGGSFHHGKVGILPCIRNVTRGKKIPKAAPSSM